MRLFRRADVEQFNTTRRMSQEWRMGTSLGWLGGSTVLRHPQANCVALHTSGPAR
jgi:hypothetical protein